MAGRKPLFDRQLGEDFIASVPMCPGVYEMLDATGRVIYVGKAKRLRRRLQQYRNARRCKKHHKMRAILREARSARITPCESDLEALLLENTLIQELKPRFNVAGAFSFLYPCIGLIRFERNLHLCYTTSPGEFAMFAHFGAYRSREITKDGFEALLEVLEFIGHREPFKSLPAYPRVRFSQLAGFRQVSDEWVPLLEDFLRGDSREFLEQAILALVEKPFARRHAAETQDLIDRLVRFFKFEARPLRQARAALGLDQAFVSQDERDRLFLKARDAGSRRRLSRAAARPS